MAEKQTTTKKRPPVRKEMAEAVAGAQESATELREAQATPEQQAKERSALAAVLVADGLSIESVASSISDLRGSIGRTLSGLSDQMESQVQRYRQLTEAIAVREKELAEVYEIERAAGTLLAIGQAQRQKQEKFDAEISEQREELESEIGKTRAEWEQESAERQQQTKAFDDAEQQRQKRVRDEFNYVFTREQKTMKDQLADEKAKLEREIEEKRRTFEQTIAEREKAVIGKEGELASLAKRAEAFPTELEKAVATAVDRETRQMRADAKNAEELIKREFAGERNVLATKVSALEQAIAERDARIEKLQQQLERAQAQVHETALRSIDGASTSRMVGDLQQRLVDSATRKGEAEKKNG